MNDFISSLSKNNKIDKIINQFSNNICSKHQKEFSLYCKTCSIDICIFCLNSHDNHKLINYQKIIPKNEEIKLLLDSIKKYNDDYNNLLMEIFQWRKEIDKMILYFQEQLKNDKILENINFIYNYNYFKINFYSILKFRQIFSNVIGPNSRKNNNQALNFMTKEYKINENFYNDNKMGLFDYNNYTMMKFCLEAIRGKNNKNNFFNNSNYIIKILSDIFNFAQNRNNIKKMNIFDNRTMYNKNNINSLSDGFLFSKRITNNVNIHYKIKNDENKDSKNNIIEKIIDFSSYFKTHNNKNKEENIVDNSAFSTKIGNIFLEQNKLNLQLSSEKCSKSKYDSNFLYKKSISQTPLFRHNIVRLNSNSIEKKAFSKIYYKKKSSSGNKMSKNLKSNLINRNNNSFQFNNDKSNNNSNNSKKVLKISNKDLPKIKTDNKIYINKYKQGKTYVHKKFDNLNTNQANYINSIKNITYSPKINNTENKTGKDKIYNENSNESNSNLSSDNKLNNTFTLSENVKKKLNFEPYCTNTNNNNSLKNDFQKPYYKINNLRGNLKKRYNKNTYDFLTKINENNIIKINKNSINKKYLIDANKPLYLGLELNNSNCKLCFLKENENEENNNQEIELFCFKENCYSIPTFLSFNEKKDDIEIGYQALDNFLINPSRTVFNIMKIFGKNYNELSINLNLYPYKIFYSQNSSSRPYIKVDFENKKEKKYYFEDLFILYMEKLFEIFFDKIELDAKDKKDIKNTIQIILVIGIPDNLNYFQRKIIEKLFQTHIFPYNIEIHN